MNWGEFSSALCPVSAVLGLVSFGTFGAAGWKNRRSSAPLTRSIRKSVRPAEGDRSLIVGSHVYKNDLLLDRGRHGKLQIGLARHSPEIGERRRWRWMNSSTRRIPAPSPWCAALPAPFRFIMAKSTKQAPWCHQIDTPLATRRSAALTSSQGRSTAPMASLYSAGRSKSRPMRVQ